MNKKVIFWDIDKIKLKTIKKDYKYVLLTSKSYKDVDISEFTIKPIIVSYNGSYIIDLENNKILNNISIKKDDIYPLTRYFDKHDITYKTYNNPNTYQLKIESKNYYRMLILPMFIKNKFNNVKTVYQYPIKINKELYQNYIISDKITTISNLSTIINYLNVSIDNIIELKLLSEDIYAKLNSIGYFTEFNKKGEMYNETKAKS